MKKFSKILSVALLVALVLSLGIANAFAADGDQTIVIEKAVAGETYTAYKLMDATYDGDNLTKTTPISYYYAGNASDALFDILNNYFQFEEFNSEGRAYLKVVDADGKAIDYSKVNVAGLAADINAALDANTLTLDEAGHATASGDPAVASITVSGKGYYFVDTSLGSICSIDTAGNNVKIQEKNSTTTTDKTVEEDSTGNYGDKDDADIGQTVDFKTEVKIGKGQSNVVLHDIMQTDKLAFNYDVTVTGATVNGVDKFTIYYPAHKNAQNEDVASNMPTGNSYADNTFAVAFDTAWTESLTDDETVVTVTYTAVLTEGAIVGPQTGAIGTGNDNQTQVTFGDNQSTEWDYTRTYTWGFDILKYTGDLANNPTKLAGAKFTLELEVPGTAGADPTYKALVFTEVEKGDATKATKYRFDKAGTDASGATATELVTPASGLITIEGLDADTYRLTETEAPQGYNKLLTPIKVVIDSNTDTAQGTDGTHQADGSATVTNTQGETSGTGTVNVLNNSGTQLPSTGGIGTTIFYVVGGVLVLAAIILLVTKKRMSE